MAKPPVIIGGQKVGRFKASWLLFKESWRFLRSDQEMLWVPIIVGVIQIFLFGVLVSMLLVSGLFFGETAIESDEKVSWLGYIFLFLFYVLGALSIAISQAIITHIVYIRVHGGNATLRDGITAAGNQFGALFMWAIITSTVGMILRAIAERSQIIGRIVTYLMGAAWNIMTYFVVPAIMIQKLSAPQAVKNSGRTFIATWGETLVSNVTLGLVFLCAHVLVLLAMIGLAIVSASLGFSGMLLLWIGLYVLWLLLATLVGGVLQSILRTLLYVYATEQTTDTLDFNRDLLENMLVKKAGVAEPVVNPTSPPVSPNSTY